MRGRFPRGLLCVNRGRKWVHQRALGRNFNLLALSVDAVSGCNLYAYSVCFVHASDLRRAPAFREISRQLPVGR